MIYGIGIDFIEIERIKSVLERREDAFLQRVFTERELELCPKLPQRKLEFIAGRFAGKEAVAKAFGTGIGQDMGWKDIEICVHPSGKPIVKIKKQEKQYKDLVIHISITHSKKMAAAEVIIEQK